MSTAKVVPTLMAVLLIASLNAAQAGEPVYQKCSHQKGYSSHHCGKCCHHCKDDSRGRGSRDSPSMMARAPVGAIVESVPVTRAVPSLVSMPMMAGIPVSQATRQRSEADERVDELDARVEALHLRMVTIQRSIELQTKILEELRAKGSIGGVPVPAAQ